MAATLSFQQAVSDASPSSTADTLTFTAASASGQERLVALCGIAKSSIATTAFTGVTIDGQAATQIGSTVRIADSGGNGPVLAFFRAAGTSATSVTVSFTVVSTGSVGFFDHRGALWTLSDAGSLLDTISDTTAYSGSSNMGDANLNINTVINGAVAAVFLGYSSGTRATTWTGLTERFDGNHLYSGDWFSVADLNAGSASTPLTVTATLPTDFSGGSAFASLAVSFNPAATGITGTLAATEGPDVVAINGLVGRSGTLAATEAADVAAVSGVVTWLGTLAATEAADIAAASGTVAWNAALAATEASDTAAFAGTVLSVITGTLAATEDSDTALFSAGAVSTGTLAATETADTAAATGTVSWAAVLAATEAADTASFAGTAVTLGTFAATEAADIAAMAGLVGRSGTLAATEASDVASFSGGVLVAGTLAASESPDDFTAIAFVGRVTLGEATPRPPSLGAQPRPPSGSATADPRRYSGPSTARLAP